MIHSLLNSFNPENDFFKSSISFHLKIFYFWCCRYLHRVIFVMTFYLFLLNNFLHSQSLSLKEVV